MGTRGSRLAIIQTEFVVAAVKKLNPQIEVSVKKIVTSGDRDRNSQMPDMGTAVFVKELEEALREGKIDLAVHSLKDMPASLPDGLGLIAVPERADPRDVLVSRTRLSELPAGAIIGTGSLRRSLQMADLRSDLKVVSIRGNVDTRVGRVNEGKVDGVILAAAGLTRLGLEDKITEYLPEQFIPAVGQGALALEGRLADKDVIALVSPLNHLASRQCASAERSFLRAMGGGCRSPVAALAIIDGQVLKLRGMAANAAGGKIIRDEENGRPESAEDIGKRLAQRLLKYYTGPGPV